MTGGGNTFSGPARIVTTDRTFTVQAELVVWSYGGKVHWGGFVTTDTRAEAVAATEDPYPVIELGEETFPFRAALRTARSGGLLALTGLGPSPLGDPA